MKRKIFSILFALVLVASLSLMIVVPAGATGPAGEVWVDDDYYDGGANDGHTWGYDAFATITSAVSTVASGGMVHVHPGTYSENTITIYESLTIESVSGDWHDTTINSSGGAAFQLLPFGGGPDQFHEDFTISGFTINGGSYGGSYGIYIDGLADGNTVNISNCLIYNNDTGIYGIDSLDGDIFIGDCIIAQNGTSATGIHFAFVAGTVEVTDSFIGAYWDAETSTSYEGNGGDGIAIDMLESTGSVLIDGNIIADNTGDGISDKLFGCYGELTITNNIIGAYDYDLTSDDGYFGGNSTYGISVDYVGTTGVVNIEGNKIAENYYGIEFGSGQPIDGDVTINNNYIGAWADYTTVSEVLYTRTYHGNSEKGIYVLTVGATGSLVIINNKVAENAYGIPNTTGIHIATTNGDTIISANHVGAWTQNIPGGEPVSYHGNGGPGILVNYVNSGSLLIHGNTIAGNTSEESGIHIESAVETADISIDLNDILDNDGDGVYYKYQGAGYLPDIYAENNWWGDISGPGGEGPGSGDGVSENVDYDPWLGVTVDNALAGTITDDTLDNIDGADTEVVVTGSATVTTASYSGDPSGTSFSGDIGKYIDVHIDNEDADATEIEIRLYYTDAEIAGMDETSLVLQWWDGSAWVACSDSGVNTTGVDSYSGYIWARIRSDTTPTLAQLTGSVFGGSGEEERLPTGGDSTAPHISNVSICYDGVTETTADICWSTNERSTSQVRYWASPIQLSALDESYVNTHHVQLTGLAPSTTYSYQTMSRDMAGNLAISDVYTFTTTGEGTVATLGESPVATFASSNLSISPSEVSIGETVTISVVVTNTGNLAGSYQLALKVNGVVAASEELTLDADASGSVSFTVTEEAAGNYSVEVDGLNGSFTVTEAAVSPAGGTAATGGASINWPLVGGIIAGVVVVGLIVFFVVRRRARGYVWLWIR